MHRGREMGCEAGDLEKLKQSSEKQNEKNKKNVASRRGAESVGRCFGVPRDVRTPTYEANYKQHAILT